jgi:hypothetical protein
MDDPMTEKQRLLSAISILLSALENAVDDPETSISSSRMDALMADLRLADALLVGGNA